MEALRLMAVHAHPDDESSKGAATTARYVHEGAEVLVVTCTGGERGDVLNPRLKDDPHIQRDIVEVRRQEMARAQAAAADLFALQRRQLGDQVVWVTLQLTTQGLNDGAGSKGHDSRLGTKQCKSGTARAAELTCRRSAP